MKRIFKWLWGDKNGSPAPASGAPADGMDIEPPRTPRPVAPTNAFAGHEPIATFVVDPTEAEKNSWIAKGDTYLKKTTQLAQALDDNEKRLARPGDVLTGISYGPENGHHRLTGATMNEIPVEDGWFFFDTHWSKT